MAAPVSQARLLISEPLCYIAAKYGRIDNLTLKSILRDFYGIDALMSARDTLMKSGDELNIDKWPKPARRRKDSFGNKFESAELMVRNEIDAIITIWSFVDDNKLVDRLPTFVAVNPDHLPSAKFVEGDFMTIMNKLNTLDQHMTNLGSSMDKCIETVSDSSATVRRAVEGTRGTVMGMSGGSGQQRGAGAGGGRGGGLGGGGRGGGGRGGGNGGGEGSEGPRAGTGHVGRPEQALGATQSADNVSWSTLPPPDNAFWGEQMTSDMLDSNSSAMEDDGGGPWNLQKNKKRRLTKGSSPSPSAPSQVPAMRTVPATPAAGPKKIVYGHSTTASLKASKNLWVNKSVYCLGNVDAVYTADNVRDFVESMGIRVVTCNLLKTLTNQPADNNRFRIAIFSEDNDKLLNSRNWSVGISIRKWVHKPKAQPNVADNPVDNADASVESAEANQACVGHECNSMVT